MYSASRTTWRAELGKIQDGDQIMDCTLSETELDLEFDAGIGGQQWGKEFTAWSEKWVYFPVVYDGEEWAGRVRRNPCDEASLHHGGPELE